MKTITTIKQAGGFAGKAGVFGAGVKRAGVFVFAALAGFAAANGAADGASFGGNSISDLWRHKQMALFAGIDGALATQAENALTGNFSAVRKADVQVQTKLGGRKGNAGLDLIGSFADSDSFAFGWQLRAFIGQDSSRGANAGVFRRMITDNGIVLGANAFFDYESGDYGGFSRIGIGGEVRNSVVSFAANYYGPITGEKGYTVGVDAFSRAGFDARVRVNSRNFTWLKAALDYYHFDGKGSAKAEDGLRYGAEVNVLPGLHLGLFYDDGGEKFGGDIVYAWTIGEVQTRQSGEAFSPDLFAPVAREYSQRIATVLIAQPPTIPPPPQP